MIRMGIITMIRSPRLSRACAGPILTLRFFILHGCLYAGEDIRFIARRIMICASEDVGNADPQALQVAVAAAQAVERIGMPESQLILSQAAIYVACAPKSNSCDQCDL